MTTKHIFKIFFILCIFLTVSTTNSQAAFGYIKRGFKHCTGICDQQSICDIEQDEKFRWCVNNCSHKIQVKQLCESIVPLKLRPILPYETFNGDYNTNEVSPLALSGLDIEFIKQTKDKRRLVGTVKRVLLVAEQYVNGKDIQKLSGPARADLAEKLLRNVYKNDPEVIKSYEETASIPDETLANLFANLRDKIMKKYENSSKL